VSSAYDKKIQQFVTLFTSCCFYYAFFVWQTRENKKYYVPGENKFEKSSKDYLDSVKNLKNSIDK
jgi:hypothetical protein